MKGRSAVKGAGVSKVGQKREKCFKWDDERGALVEVKKPRRGPRKAALSLAPIQAALPETSDPVEQPLTSRPKAQPIQRVTTKRGRKLLLTRELSHFRRVLEHPAFQKDPMGALSEHLNNSLKNK